MKKLLKILKWIGLGFLGLLLIFTIAGFFMSEELPKGSSPNEADRLAEQILEELNYEAYKNTSYIGWTFAGIHSYEWHKADDYVIVKSDDYEVKLDLSDYSKSEVISSKNSDEQALIKSCIKNFNNDSFWLVAPYKIMEDQVERKIVRQDGDKSLLVTYTSGGSTPGDSYLWKLDQNKRPTSFKMWVSIIPVGGLEAQWTNWKSTDSGAVLSTRKTVFGIPIEISNLVTKP
ncbi:hypothetical protein [Psychroflexus tropicus]|uniref:hypothetical protein n=1 Tax=Psychroflexus tropicus TaxID=197345 RepID=UPI00037DECDC|nr:hypothetical protein [Psychroflexus tropicus]